MGLCPTTQPQVHLLKNSSSFAIYHSILITFAVKASGHTYLTYESVPGLVSLRLVSLAPFINIIIVNREAWLVYT